MIVIDCDCGNIFPVGQLFSTLVYSHTSENEIARDQKINPSYTSSIYTGFFCILFSHNPSSRIFKSPNISFRSLVWATNVLKWGKLFQKYILYNAFYKTQYICTYCAIYIIIHNNWYDFVKYTDKLNDSSTI